MADPADADVISAIERDAVPGQRTIGGGELAAIRAGVGGVRLRLNVGRGVGRGIDRGLEAGDLGDELSRCF